MTLAVIPGKIVTSRGGSNPKVTSNVRVSGSAVVANSLTQAGNLLLGIEVISNVGLVEVVISFILSPGLI